jgi:hypothetical protein
MNARQAHMCPAGLICIICDSAEGWYWHIPYGVMYFEDLMDVKNLDFT